MRTLLDRLHDAEANGEALWQHEHYRRDARPPYSAPWWQARVDVDTTSLGLGAEVFVAKRARYGVGVQLRAGPLYLSLARYRP